MAQDGSGIDTDMLSTIKQTTIAIDDAVLECFVVPWDSASFGFTVAAVSRIALGSGGSTDRLLRDFERWCAERDVRFVSCRLDHDQLRASMALEGIGFRFVEMVYRPRLDSLERCVAPAEPVEVSPAEPSDLPGIEDIARRAFTTGRFALDRRLPSDLSARRYASWVRTSFDDPRHTVFKAELDGDIVGFFIVEQRSDASVYWHLTAVAPPWQGRGIGLRLWQTMLARHRVEGATAIETTISGHNAAAINLYARLGFSFASAQMTFHWVRDQAS